jgi:putative NADPH-quinone reductase
MPAARRALVIHADPDPASYTTTLCHRTVGGLAGAGWQVDVADLHADRFTPAMTTAEHRAYHGPQPILDPLVGRYAELVRDASAMVFVFPTSPCGLPPMLKGWLERVLLPGVAFRFDADGRVRPALTGLRRLLGVTTYRWGRARTAALGDPGRRVILRAVRLNAPWRCRTGWLGLHDADRAAGDALATFAARVETRMATL